MELLTKLKKFGEFMVNEDGDTLRIEEGNNVEVLNTSTSESFTGKIISLTPKKFIVKSPEEDFERGFEYLAELEIKLLD